MMDLSMMGPGALGPWAWGAIVAVALLAGLVKGMVQLG